MNKKFFIFLLPIAFLSFSKTYSVDQTFSVKIRSQSEVRYEDQSLTSADFELQEDGSFEYNSSNYTNPTWTFINNQKGSPNLKVQGSFKSGSTPSRGWTVYTALNAPQNSNGSFGESQGEKELSTTAQDFVKSIPKGNSGDLQEQTYRINVSSSAWQAAAESGSESFIIEWTISDDT